MTKSEIAAEVERIARAVDRAWEDAAGGPGAKWGYQLHRNRTGTVAGRPRFDGWEWALLLGSEWTRGVARTRLSALRAAGGHGAGGIDVSRDNGHKSAQTRSRGERIAVQSSKLAEGNREAASTVELLRLRSLQFRLGQITQRTAVHMVVWASLGGYRWRTYDMVAEYRIAIGDGVPTLSDAIECLAMTAVVAGLMSMEEADELRRI